MPTQNLGQLGWRSFYSQQLTLEDLEIGLPARIAGVHRNRVHVLTESAEQDVLPPGEWATQLDSPIAVGDWVLIERDAPRLLRVLNRASLISRLAAGTQQRIQSIAANVDTLFVVTSCNDDFNPSRLERYLSIAFESQVQPVVLLTKSDLTDKADDYLEQLRHLAPQVESIAINALSGETVSQLQPWLTSGQTVAFVGSSGVGKSTLVNTLSGASLQATAGIREDDARGRHTTTSRQLIAMPGGAWLIDTPGMRELKIGAVERGLEAAFTDLSALARSCRFRDCSHAREQGCALERAVQEGTLDSRRLDNYLKLEREAANAARSLRERRERERQFGRLSKAVQTHKRRRNRSE